MTSLDGDVYVDFLGEFTAGIYGHSNQEIKEAVSEAMGKGWNLGGPNPYERELARKVTFLRFARPSQVLALSRSQSVSLFQASSSFALRILAQKQILWLLQPP